MLRSFSRKFSAARPVWAGHSKWQNIKHKKARNDKDRSAQFTRISHQITVAAKEGAPDPTKNVRLAAMIEMALKQNLPKRVIESAIERAAPNSAEGVTIVYEGMGPGGSAYIVEAMTNNKNRTAQNVRAAFTKFGAQLAPCLYLFEKRGYLFLATTEFDAVFEVIVDVAQDVLEKPGGVLVYTSPADLTSAAKLLKDYEIEDMGVAHVPLEDQIPQLDDETRQRADSLVLTLEQVEDVVNVSTNLEL